MQQGGDGDEVARPLIYLADWLPPQIGATGQYALIFATEKASAGRAVRLIGLTTGAASQTETAFEGGGHLAVVRLHARARRSEGYAARIAWSLASGARIALAALPHCGGGEVLFTGSPPFMLYFAVALKALKRARLTYRITDFYPEVVIAARDRPSLLLSAIAWLTWRLRGWVDRFEVLGEDQRQILLDHGVPPAAITLVRDGSPVAFSGHETPLARPAPLQGRLALLYSGNLGVAHEIETVSAGLAAHHRQGSDRFALWINGWGARADRLAQDLERAGAPVARTAAAPLEDLARLLVSADAHLVTLRPAFAGYVLPSKIYACVASGKPILFVGPAASDVDLICRQATGLDYRRIEPGDVAGFQAALEALADSLAGAAPT